MTETHQGSPLLPANDRIEMNAAAETFRALHGQVPAGGVLRSHAGINFPTYSLSKPALSDKDIPDFFFGVNQAWI